MYLTNTGAGLVVMVLIASALVGPVQGVLIDLTYKLNNNTAVPPDPNWGFSLHAVKYGKWKGHGDIWHEMNNFRMSEHVGTHIDAPIHFAKGGNSVDEIPLADLIKRPAVVVDITERARQDPNTQLLIDDLTGWEKVYGRIPDKSVVLVNSGWGAYWGTPNFLNITRYANGSIKKMNFPSISNAAAKWLVEKRDIVGVGIDTTSVESEPGTLYTSHRYLQGANKYNIENGANFDKLPPIGAFLTIMPLPIDGGSGSPARIYAEWDTDDNNGGASSHLVSGCTMVLSLSMMGINLRT